MSSPKEKKRKAEEEPSNEKSPPPYGSQTYWEDRYKKHRTVLEAAGGNAQEANASAPGEIVADNDALPLHAWYFTYSELRPLILPLILGGRDEAMQVIMDTNSEDVLVDAGTSEEFDNVPADKAEPKDNDKESPEEVSPLGEYEEESEEDLEDLDSHEAVMAEREGLAKEGPISILEIGCGDVPLGKDLAQELRDLEVTTGAKAGNVVKSIVCCDYSETVIEMLKSSQQSDYQPTKQEPTKRKQGNNVENSGGNLDTNTDPQVDYIVADARKLPYSEGEFHLVLEKGTLDAMLSDKEIGVSNCVSIVTECARVLAVGGFIVIVSHLNAHTQNGLGWLDEVVVVGLRAGGGAATWEIEVHANDGLDGQEEGNEEDEQGGSHVSPMGSPGPAVYVIRKKPPEARQEDSSKADDPPSIPLKFYGY